MLCVDLRISETTYGAGTQRLLHLHTGGRLVLHFDRFSPSEHVCGNHLGDLTLYKPGRQRGFSQSVIHIQSAHAG